MTTCEIIEAQSTIRLRDKIAYFISNKEVINVSISTIKSGYSVDYIACIIYKV